MSADIIDGNLKLILGMIWTLILRFTIADIRLVTYAFLHRPDVLNVNRSLMKRRRLVC